MFLETVQDILFLITQHSQIMLFLSTSLFLSSDIIATLALRGETET